MRLSTAMMLPCDIPFDTHKYLAPHGACLLGQAMNVATGKKHCYCRDIEQQWPWLETIFKTPALIHKYSKIYWATGEQIISYFAFGIEAGRFTREQAADWVRQNEPPEPDEIASESGSVGQSELILSDLSHVNVGV